MPRKIILSTRAKSNINKFVSEVEPIVGSNNIENFKTQLSDFLLSEKKNLKDVNETTLILFYTKKILQELKDHVFSFDIEYLNKIKQQVRQSLASYVTKNNKHYNNIDIYFDEVKAEYIKHPVTEQDELQFLPENRDIFIKNNLKQVIECAKRYRGMGLEFDDLIQYGNEGLLKAFDKYDTERANLRINIIKSINTSNKESFTKQDAEDIVRRNFLYTKNLVNTIETLPKNGFNNKDEFISWAKTNIKSAVFSSVAFQWTRAIIVQALNSQSRVIRVPKSSKTDIDGNPIHKLSIVNLDAENPHTDDIYHDNQISEVVHEEFAKNDENIEKIESSNVFNDILKKFLYNLTNLDRRILKKRFGIDYPYQLAVYDIAEDEGVSTITVKESLDRSLKYLNDNIKGQDREILLELLH